MGDIKNNRRGINLIELVLVIVILSISIPPLIGMLADVTKRSTEAELYYKGIVAGRDLMEEILTKRFDEKTTKTGGSWSNIGSDPGDTVYDDVDDYDGFVDDSVSGYRREVSVHYVDPDHAPSGCMNGTQDYPLDCFKDDNTLDYKRIDIKVSHNLISDLYFSCIVSSQH